MASNRWRHCLQAELVAIRGALHHALESHSPHVIIHTDSKPFVQALRDTQPQDNIHLLTSTLLRPNDWLHVAAKSPPNWVPSHVGPLVATKRADRAAKSAAALPSPTTAVLSQPLPNLLKIKSASHALSRQQHKATVAPIITLCLLVRCCNSFPTPSPKTHPSPHVRDRHTVSASAFPA
ncbi:hypothetical protein GWK47_011776 [Chionoecetes opilio]|uniref:RNase H type-1 domain-containing protein n=1 Tax=Chionoecetes opilio TaxID=41210 RepID=A0A8J5CMX5_CHIOP|nr:hypothetical protein GWK47_011776 [Chionoecetes opilio]